MVHKPWVEKLGVRKDLGWKDMGLVGGSSEVTSNTFVNVVKVKHWDS